MGKQLFSQRVEDGLATMLQRALGDIINMSTGGDSMTCETHSQSSAYRYLWEEPVRVQWQVPSQESRGDLELVASIVHESLVSKDMDSSWTSALARRILSLGPLEGDVARILAVHGWIGSQFTGPPNRKQLLHDLHGAKPMLMSRRCCGNDGV